MAMTKNKSLVLSSFLVVAFIIVTFSHIAFAGVAPRKVVTSTVTPVTFSVGMTNDVIQGIAFNSYSQLFITDQTANIIYVCSADGGVSSPLTRFAGTGAAASSSSGSQALSASINAPSGGVIANGNLYFVENGGNCARRIDLSTLTLYTVAGICGSAGGFSGDSGSPLVAQLKSPTSIAVDTATNRVFIADSGNGRVRVVNGDGTIISTLVDLGSSTTIDSIAFDAKSSLLYITSVSGKFYGRVNAAGQFTALDIRSTVSPTFKFIVSQGDYADYLIGTDGTSVYVFDSSMPVTNADKGVYTSIPLGMSVTGPNSVAYANGILFVGTANSVSIFASAILPRFSLIPSANGQEWAIDYAPITNSAWDAKAIQPKFLAASNTGSSCSVIVKPGVSGTPSAAACNTNAVSIKSLKVRYRGNAYACGPNNIVQVNGATMSTIFGVPGTAAGGTMFLTAPTAVTVDSVGNILIADGPTNKRFVLVTSAGAFTRELAFGSATWSIRAIDVEYAHPAKSLTSDRLWFIGSDTATGTGVLGYVVATLSGAYTVFSFPLAQLAVTSGKASTFLQLLNPTSLSVIQSSHTSSLLVVDSGVGAIRIDFTESLTSLDGASFELWASHLSSASTYPGLGFSVVQPQWSSIFYHPLGIVLAESGTQRAIVLPTIHQPGVSILPSTELDSSIIDFAMFATALDGSGNLWVANKGSAVFMLPNQELPEIGFTTAGLFTNAISVAVSGNAKDQVYVLDSNHCIKQYNAVSGAFPVVAGTCGTASTTSNGDGGTPAAATFKNPTILKSVGGTGNENSMLVIDNDRKNIRVINWALGSIGALISAPTNVVFLDVTFKPPGVGIVSGGIYLITYRNTASITNGIYYFDPSSGMGLVSLASTAGAANLKNIDAIEASSSALSGYTFGDIGSITWVTNDVFYFTDSARLMKLSVTSAYTAAGMAVAPVLGTEYQATSLYGSVALQQTITTQDWSFGTVNNYAGANRRGSLDVITAGGGTSFRTSADYLVRLNSNRLFCVQSTASGALSAACATTTPNSPYSCVEGAVSGGNPINAADSTTATRTAGTLLVSNSYLQTVQSDLIVSMISAANLQVSIVATSSPLSVAAVSMFSVTILGGQSSTTCSRIRVKFAPTCVGTFDVQLSISGTGLSSGVLVSKTYAIRGVARGASIGVQNTAMGVPQIVIPSGLAASTVYKTDLGVLVPSSGAVVTTFQLINVGVITGTMRQSGISLAPGSSAQFTLNTAGVAVLKIMPPQVPGDSFTVTFTPPATCGRYNATILVVTDDCSKTYTINMQVIVATNTAPVFTCPATPAPINVTPGRCSAPGPDLSMSLSATWCGVSWPYTGPAPALPNNVYPVGTTTVVYNSTDLLGRSSQCSVAITVVDNEKPTLSCPRSIQVSQCFATVNYLPPVPVDNCQASVALTTGLASGSVFPVGVTTVVYTATDTATLQASCSFTVTITAANCIQGGAASGNVVDPTVDYDGDGVTTQQGDCCESTEKCRDPYLVNPGALEIPGNGIDDNCNGIVDENHNCDFLVNEQRLQSLTLTNIELFARALGICDRVDDDSDRSTGYFYYSPFHPRITLADGITANRPSPLQLALLRSFGGITAINGNGIVLSTGAARLNGELGKTGVDMNMGTVCNAPSAWPSATGSNQLPFPAGCPLILNRAFDSIRFRVNIRMPSNMNGFAVRFLFGAEQPDGRYPPTNLCQAQKDFFLILTDAKSAPPGGNIAVDSDREYISTLNPSAFFWSRCNQYSSQRACSQGPYSLTNTGYDGASRWTTVGANVDPGKQFYIDFVLFDAGDALRDSFVFIDQLFYTVEAATNPTYGVRWFSDLTISSFKAPSNVLSSSATPTASITFTIKNNGPEPASDVYLSLTPPRGTTFISTSISNALLTCKVQGTTASGGPNQLQKCAVTQSIPARGELVGSIVLGVNSGFQGSVTVRLTVSSSSVDQNLGNNSRSVTFNARP